MSKQLLLEVSLISSVFVLVSFIWFTFRRSPLSAALKVQKLLTGLLGVFLVMAGTVKFFEPFNTMFTKQIALSELPFPELARWAGQLGEISAGIGFLLVLILALKLTKATLKNILYGTSFLTVIIMTVAVYVHLIPSVPAEVLPLQSKPPVLTLIVMAIVGLNAWLFKKST